MATQPVPSRLTTPEAARLVGVAPRTLERLRERGEGPPYLRLTKRLVVYERDDLLGWIRSRRVEPGDARQVRSASP